jgi:hypothetical protein
MNLLKKEKNVYAGTGISKKDDPYEAGKEAAEMAIKKCGKAPDFALLFFSHEKYGGSEENAKKLVKGADDAFKAANPHCKWVGCSSKKEISNYGYTENTVVAMAISSQFIHFGVGVGKNTGKSPKEAGRTAVKASLQDVKVDKYLDSYINFTAMKNKNVEDALRIRPYHFLLLLPGLSNTYFPKDNLIIEGIREVVGLHPLMGAEASENWKFGGTYTIHNGVLEHEAAIVVSIVSNVKMNISVKHGYSTTNQVMVVTKAKDNEVFELNGQPAAEVYAKIVNTSIEDLSKNILQYLTKNPFGIQDVEGNFWLNCPYSVGKEKSLLFFEPLKQGMAISVMTASKKDIIESAKTAIEKSTHSLADLEALFVFSCSARLISLGEDIKKEYELVKKTAKDKPFIGFSCYAEIASLPTNPGFSKHGYTFVCAGLTNNLITE